MIGHLHYIMSSKYELFFYLLSVALVIINHRTKKGRENLGLLIYMYFSNKKCTSTIEINQMYICCGGPSGI